MFSEVFGLLDRFDDFVWTYVSVPVLILIGIYFTTRFRLPQPSLLKKSIHETFFTQENRSEKSTRGVAPLQAFFTSIGGCIGIGNVVAVCSAIQIGGPGAMFWMWVAAFIGMIVKYSEVYLGVKFRIPNNKGSFDGGPMFYLSHAFKGKVVPVLVAILLALYGTEVYMFSVVTDSIAINWNAPRIAVIIGLLILIMLTASGGVKRVGQVCSIVIPVFLFLYVGMSLYVLAHYFSELGQTLVFIFRSAFSPQATLGGAVGSSILVTISQGVARGCYSGDIGIGYAAVVHAESSTTKISRQARLAVLGIFIDTFIVCTSTTLLITVSGVWSSNLPASSLVQEALSQHFGYMSFFMPVFIFLLGYSSMIAFFVVGLKCARFLFPKWGQPLYYVYATSAFLTFSFIDQTKALTVMSISGGLLLVINLLGMFRLRKEVSLSG